MDNINEKKILCLSLRTPPEPRPQAILIGKMIPEWMRQGVNPVVVTYKKEKKWDIDTPVYEIKPLKNSRIPIIREFILYRNAAKHCRQIQKIIKKEKINLIFSFSNPQYSNLLGAMLKNKTGIKFISHFSDPWYDDPYHKLSFFAKREVLKQERYIIKNSDRAIFVNEAAKELIMKKYPSSWIKKAKVIPHCYQVNDYPELEKNNDKFVFSYIGVFYKQRTPEIFFKAIRNLINKNKELENKILIKIIGGADNYSRYSKDDLSALVNKYNLNNIVKILEPVSYKESLKEMKSADCLLVIDADIKNSPFLPSKIIDYAASLTPILGVTTKNSPTEEFLSSLGYKSFYYNQLEELTSYVKNLVENQADVNINKNYLKEFEVSNTSKKLISHFKEALNEKK